MRAGRELGERERKGGGGVTRVVASFPVLSPCIRHRNEARG